jgi:hypothetical protein
LADSREGIDDSAIKKLVDLRNDIVHRGMSAGAQDLWESIILVREIIVRIVLTMVKFEGQYECYIGGGQHTRQFPPCRPLTG